MAYSFELFQRFYHVVQMALVDNSNDLMIQDAR